jgi:predicted HD phosphohydrolase
VTAALYIDLDHLKNKRRRNHMHFKEIAEKENERETTGEYLVSVSPCFQEVNVAGHSSAVIRCSL